MTDQLIEKAPAKVNLSLGCTGKQADGYHLLEMVNHSVDLNDELILTPAREFSFRTNIAELNNKDNLVLRVIQIFCQLLGRTPDFKIDLIKNIPYQAGLAGGSSDAAAMIRLLVKYWGLELTRSQLASLGLKCGADVPYCLSGGTAYVEGIGEKVFPIKDFKPPATLMVNPDFKMTTPRAYGLLDQQGNLKNPDNMKVVRAIEEGNYNQLKDVAGNVFIDPVSQEFPEIKNIIDTLYENEAFYATMSGSGTSLVGYFNNITDRDRAAAQLGNYETLNL